MGILNRKSSAGRGNGAVYNPLFRNTAGALWLRGDSLTQSSGSVTGWVDKFGNWPTATVGNAPAYSSSVSALGNTAAATYINASNQSIAISSFAINQPNTIYVIARVSTPGSVNQGIIDASTTSRQIIWAEPANTITLNMGSSNLSTTAVLPGAICLCSLFGGGSISAYIGNSQTANASSATGGANNISGLVIGNVNGLGHGITADIAEILIVPGLDDAIRRAQIFAYAGQYYSQSWA